MPVQPGEIGVPDGQIAVGMVARRIHEAVAGTVHWLGRVFPVVGVYGEHLVPEMLVMAGGLPQAGFVDQRGDDFVVPVLVIQSAHVIGQGVVDPGAFREEEGRRRRIGMKHEQPELPAQLAVIPPFGLGAPFQVLVQVLPAGIGHAVYPLQALVVLVPVPVGGRDAEQLEGLDLSGRRDVRAPAEIDEIPLLVDADHLVRFEVVDHLDLVGLAPLGEQGAGVLAGELAAPDGHVRPGQLDHAALDALEIIGRERLRHVEVVVESLFDRRTDGQLRFGKQLLGGLGHQVRRAVPVHLPALGIAEGQHLQGGVPVQPVVQIDLVAVDLGRERRLAQSGTNARHRVHDRRPLLHFELTAVGKRDPDVFQ